MKILALTLLMATVSLFSAQIIPLPDIYNPDAIAVDKNQVYITAFPDVYIFSLKNFKLVKKFGKKGEGPSEYLRYAVPYIRANQLVFGDRNKMLYFKTNGDYIKEIKAKSMINWGGVPFGKGFVARSRDRVNNLQYDTLNLYDANLNKIKEIAMYKFFYQEKASGKNCDAMEVRGIQFQVYGNQLYFKQGKDFIIDIFDESGNKINTITHEYKKIKINEADETRYHDYFKATRPWKDMYETDLKKEIFFEDNFPAIQTFVVADDKIYVLTYEKKDKESKFIILNLKGDLLKEVFLPLDQSDEWFQYSLTKIIMQASPNPTFTIKDETLYQIIENDTTESWELQVTPIK